MSVASTRLVLTLLCFHAGCASADDKTAAETGAAHAHELVVLVHGMGRTPLSMTPIEQHLEAAGFRVMNWGYSSYCCTIAELGERLRADLTANRGDAERIHFVGHSLGNIIVRWLLTQDEAPAGVGRVVMLAPPNQGSHDADRYARWFGTVMKPLPELTTDSLSTVRRLPVPANIQIGIVAGESDGKVTVTETRLAGVDEHITVTGGHTFLMARSHVRELVLAFITDGAFDRAGVQPPHN